MNKFLIVTGALCLAGCSSNTTNNYTAHTDAKTDQVKVDGEKRSGSAIIRLGSPAKHTDAKTDQVKDAKTDQVKADDEKRSGSVILRLGAPANPPLGSPANPPLTVEEKAASKGGRVARKIPYWQLSVEERKDPNFYEIIDVKTGRVVRISNN